MNGLLFCCGGRGGGFGGAGGVRDFVWFAIPCILDSVEEVAWFLALFMAFLIACARCLAFFLRVLRGCLARAAVS